jgi:hypothetical protein
VILIGRKSSTRPFGLSGSTLRYEELERGFAAASGEEKLKTLAE